MAKITQYSIEDKRRWDEIVLSFYLYDVFYLSGYSEAFMKENPENGIPKLLLYENGEDRAISVVFIRDVAVDKKMGGRIEKGKYFDLVTPYGYGGFMGRVSDWDMLNQTYRTYCLNNHYICEFVRFELFSDFFKHYLGETETRTHNVVRSLEISLDEIWMDFKQKVRKNVNRANANQLKIIIEANDHHLDDFLRIYYATMDRTAAEKAYYFSREFFESLSEMKDNAIFFYATYEERIISAELVIYGSENCYSYLGGTDNAYFDVRPNDFLKYEIIKWAKEKGLKNYVLGGGYGADDGIFQYKYCLAPHGVYDFYIGRTIFDSKLYEFLVSFRENDQLKEDYFPLYRS